ncbi:uncharacterized protein LOC135714343 [Ochlerotatus camptorhynchus]
MGSTIHPHSLHQSPSIGLEAADVDSVCKFKSLSQTAFQASPDNELHEPGDIPVKLELKEEPQPQLSVSPATVRSRVQTRRSSDRPEIQGQLETHFKEGDQKQQLPAHFHRQKQQPKAAAKQRKNKSNHQHPNTGKLSHDNVASQKTTEMGSTIHPHSFDQLPSIGLEAADVDLVCKFESLSQTAFQASPDNELLERGGISVKLEPQEESQPQLSVSPATARPNQASPGDEEVRDSFDGWRVHSIVPVAEIKSTVLQIEFGFRFKSENFPIKGTMRYYDCRRIKFRSRPQCERKLLVFIPNSDVPATISIRGKHTCATAPPEHLARTKLNEQQSDLIEGLLKSGIPSKDIKKHVRVVNSTVSKNQLNYAVKSTRQKLFGNGVFSIGELEEWAASKSAVPNDERDGFVIGKDIDHENKSFRVIFSSKRLLSLLAKFNIVAADCTFKVTLEGYPLLVVVVIDNMRHAHPVAFGIIAKQEQTDYEFAFRTITGACSRLGIKVVVETFLSDGELAMKNGARIVFDDPTIINCYFHFMQNVIKHLKKYNEIPDEVHAKIKRDIGLLQVSATIKHFTTGIKLFLQKYEQFPNFINFMNKYTYDNNFCRWYEAAKPGAPATNNALEALNKSLKYNHMNRQKEPFCSFKAIILKIIYEYGDPLRDIAQERNFISITNERKAFDWLKMRKKMRTCQAPMEGKQYVYLPGRQKAEVSLHDIQSFENPEYRTFDQFVEDFGSLHRVDVSSYEWNSWNCTCYHFLKKNFCCHVLAVAVNRGKHVLGAESNTTAMGRKKPVGRPKIVSKALIVD